MAPVLSPVRCGRSDINPIVVVRGAAALRWSERGSAFEGSRLRLSDERHFHTCLCRRRAMGQRVAAERQPVQSQLGASTRTPLGLTFATNRLTVVIPVFGS